MIKKNTLKIFNNILTKSQKNPSIISKKIKKKPNNEALIKISRLNV
jgi:hypothetical protein